MTDQLDFFSEAEARKQQGMDQVDANASDWWKACADQAISHMAGTGRVFQAADLADLGVPEPHHPNAWGARMNAAAKRGVIERVGSGPSRRATVAKSLVYYWRGTADSLASALQDGAA